MTTGTVTTVTTDWRGDTLTTLADAGDLVLQVASVVDFDMDGGWLIIGDSAPIEYATIDEDADTIQLSDVLPLLASYEAGLPVIVWDPTVGTTGAQVVEYVATVALHDDAGTPDAVIPHSMIPVSGVELLVGASVRIAQSEDGEWFVDEVLGREAQIQGALVAMPIQTAEDGKRVVVTSENGSAVLFYTGNDEEAPLGAGYVTSTATDLGSTVILQTALGGPLISGGASQPTLGLTSQRSGTTYTTYVTINADRLVLNGDRVESPNMFVTAAPTTGGAANVNIGPGGQLRESTSSLRYKQDVERVEIDPAAVLKLQGKTWRDRNAVEADPETGERHVGFIAEDLHDLGLTEFVTYDEQGRPNAIQYDRLAVALLSVVQDQETRLRRLEAAVL